MAIGTLANEITIAAVASPKNSGDPAWQQHSTGRQGHVSCPFESTVTGESVAAEWLAHFGVESPQHLRWSAVGQQQWQVVCISAACGRVETQHPSAENAGNAVTGARITVAQSRSDKTARMTKF
jgi:hypothetical protein